MGLGTQALTGAGELAGADKWVWIELIAFDNEQEDLGVSAVLEPMAEQPALLSILLYSAEFLHSHRAVDSDLLPIECTAYFARSWSIRGPRQDWTRAQLRDLVRALQERGVQVFFALFDMHAFEDGGVSRISSWNEAHPELTVIDRTGTPRIGAMNPLGRLADGSYYEDFLAARLEEVFDYYAFDGFHGADGYSSGRLPIWEADFSADMVDQFRASTGCEVPSLEVRGQAEWIWEHARIAWIQFHAQRWNGFWGRVSSVIHQRGGRVVLNNAWTRDPFEALYRYGVDYRGLVAAGVDGLILETVVAAVEMLERPPALPPLPGQLAAALLVSATIPTTPLSTLISVHDTLEGWDVIHVAPGMHERDIRLLTSLRRFLPGEASTQACITSATYCLSDGLTRADWEWMDAVRNSGVRGVMHDAPELTLLYDPEILLAELGEFVSSRRAHTHALLADLLRSGIPINAIGPIAAHREIGGPVLIVHPDCYPAELIEEIRATHPHPVFTLGATGDDAVSWQLLQCYRGGREEWVERVDGAAVDIGGIETHDSWVYELRMNRLAPGLIASLGEAFARETSSRVSLVDPDGVSSVAQRESSNEWHVVVSNPTDTFRNALLRFDAPVLAATRLPGVTAKPPKIVENRVECRVPPRGVVAIRVALVGE